MSAVNEILEKLKTLTLLEASELVSKIYLLNFKVLDTQK